LGGADFDRVIINYFADEFKKEHGIDISEDKAAMQRLRDEAEKAKIELSSAQEVNINLPFLTADAEGPKHFEHKLTRAKLESLVADLIDKTAAPCEKALKDAGLKAADINAVVLVGGMTRMPAVQEKVKRIFGKDPMKGVNPDEVVAIGAAIQGGVLQGDVKDVLLLDVTPLSLGIETMGGVMTKLIERNTTIPTSKSEVFSTAADNQPQVEVHVGQGERDMIEGNKSLGRFILDGIPPAPRGVPQIEVTFNIDANGILNVTAKDKGSGKEQSITISGSGNLDKSEVEKMAKEAEAHADEDKAKKEAVEARNLLDSAVYQAEKLKKDSADKIADDDMKTLNEAIDSAKKVVGDEKAEKESLENAAKELNDKLMPIGAKMYEQSEAADTDTPSEGEAGETKKAAAKDEPLEGEVVDDKKE
jgi:molecular chaperone DnaK